MARRPILEYPDAALRRRARPVAAFDGALAHLVDDLTETLRATGGLGLSAPQIDDHRAVFITDLSDDGSGVRAWVNPAIVDARVPALVEESCLSIPGVVGNVIRSTELDVRARDGAGRAVETHLSGMEAVAFQHELDHLEGRLFIDRLSVFRRLRIGVGARRRQRRSARLDPRTGSR